jgi:hypothetical protein
LLYVQEYRGMRCDSPAEIQDQPTGMRYDLGGPVHDFLEHGAKAAALGRVPNRGDLTGQAELADEAQSVVGKGRQLQDGIVGIKLTRG